MTKITKLLCRWHLNAKSLNNNKLHWLFFLRFFFGGDDAVDVDGFDDKELLEVVVVKLRLFDESLLDDEDEDELFVSDDWLLFILMSLNDWEIWDKK